MIRVVLAVAATSAAVAAYRAGPPPGHTGAFGEPDCGACHFDAIRDDARGSLRIAAPEEYDPGRSYDVAIRLTHPTLSAAGFQLAARHADGACAGRQAGGLAPVDGRTRVGADERGVVYASHSESGVVAEDAHAITWTVRWTAPECGGPVALDVAAQVANDDDSELGERLYLQREVVRPRGHR